MLSPGMGRPRRRRVTLSVASLPISPPKQSVRPRSLPQTMAQRSRLPCGSRRQEQERDLRSLDRALHMCEALRRRSGPIRRGPQASSSMLRRRRFRPLFPTSLFRSSHCPAPPHHPQLPLCPRVKLNQARHSHQLFRPHPPIHSCQLRCLNQPQQVRKGPLLRLHIRSHPCRSLGQLPQ